MITNRALAPTTFIAGPEEDLAAPDVYEINNDAVINKLPIPAAIADVSDITGELRGGKSLLGSLPGLNELSTVLSDGSLKTSTTFGDGWSLESTSKKVADSVSGGKAGFLDSVKQISSSLTKVTSTINGVRAIANNAGPSLMSRLGNGTLNGIKGINSSSLASLGSVLLGNAMPKEVKQLFNTPIPSKLGTYSTIGSTVTKLLPGNINQSYQMSSLVNNVMGGYSSNIVDKDSTARLIAGLALGGMSSGMQNTFGAVVALAGGDKTIIQSAGQTAFRYAGSTGNIGAMRDVAQNLDPMALSSVSDSAMRSFFTNYQPSQNAPQTTSGRLVDYSNLWDVASMIDPGWMREDRMKVDPVTQLPVMDFPVTNISMVVEGSNDARNMITAGAVNATDPEEKWLAVASLFPATSPEAELKKSFPYANTSLSSNTTASNKFTPEQIKALDGITIE